MEGSVAPVVLLAYRRPQQTLRVFEAIRAAKPQDLFLVVDGAKSGDVDDQERVEQTRSIVESIDWECNVRKVYASENLGLKARVSSGLDAVFAEVESAIILEDDCLPSQSFFPFATELLGRFALDQRIGLISGSQRLRGRRLSEASYEFSKDVRIWGWATWARTWRTFRESGDLDAVWTAEQARETGELFASGLRRRSMVSMMSKSSALDSWALPFAVHCARRGYLNPVPAENLVTNIGLGPDSTHTGFESYVVEVPARDLNFPLQHPSDISYSTKLDELETKLDRKAFFTFPLLHPLDFVGRIYRYARRRVGL